MDLNLKKHFNDLIFLPLGGANEIGMNLNLYHLDGKWIMIDCGVGFAYNIPGITMMTPDISFIKQHRDNLLAIILTHIHEDHLGAVQYLWKELEAPIYTSLLAGNFLKSKLAEFKLEKTVPIKIIDNSKTLKLQPFEIDFIGLTHSVPEMQALIIKTPKGNVFHTGDWKFDPNPVVGLTSNIAKIKNYGDNNEIFAMICDSTNAINEGHSRSEGELYASLKNLMIGRNGYIGVTTFASNIARIHTIATIAKELGRKIVLSGFSINRLYEVAKNSGYFLENFDIISDREIKFYNKNEILIIATGCQGEDMASTRKIASNNHPTIHFTKGDLMIFSSKIIPGNEKKIFELFDLFAKKQIDVMTEKDHFVHVSGHPSKQELIEMYNLAKPQIAIPVHGEFIHTKTHCEIALNCGVKRSIQVENGCAIKIDKNDINGSVKIGNVKTGYMGIDGKILIDLKSDIIRERKKLMDCGVIFVSFAVSEDLKIKSKIKLISIGSYDFNKDHESEKIIKFEIEKFIKNKAKELNLDEKFGLKFFIKKRKKNRLNEHKILHEIEKSLRSKLLKIFEDLTSKRPMVEITILKI